jgi:hypothetical protein
VARRREAEILTRREIAMPTMEIVRASEMPEKVFQRIWDIRTGEERRRLKEQYARELKDYNKKRGRRPEVTFSNLAPVDGMDVKRFDIGGVTVSAYRENNATGYIRDSSVFVPRPVAPRIEDTFPIPWIYRKGWKASTGPYPARNDGLLGDAAYNREIRLQRVEQYFIEMQAGKWVDLFSDPITITENGEVLNGQHRLAAIGDCLYAFDYDGRRVAGRGMGGTDPAFLVVWGVEPNEALYADGSHRTAHDEKTIAVKLVQPAAA